MANLTAAKRAKMPAKDFAGGGPNGKKGFPMPDKKHARLAISGATRSFKAGNISKSKELSIKSRARKMLGAHGGLSDSDKKKMIGHALHLLTHKAG